MEYIVEDIETQRNGIVGISGLERQQEFLQHQDRKLDYLGAMLLRKSLPVRFVALHRISSSQLLRYTIPFILYSIGSTYRRRVIIHTDPKITLTELMKYGIDKMILPKEYGGESTFLYSEWLAERREQNR
jgi:hypothetical protein